MNSLRRLGVFFACLTAVLEGFSQKSIEDSCITFAQLGIVYGGAIPGADLADRFGYSSTLGGEVGLKWKSNLYANIGCRFLFGNEIREPIAENITSLQGTTETGYTPMALGTDGRWYEARMYERGFVLPMSVGYVLPLLGVNPNSGIYVEAGGQFILHNVRIEVPGNAVPGLYGDYSKGYDRLASGFGINQGLGYRFHNNQRLINFTAGFEFSQNFTQGRRDIQFDTGLPATGSRLDILWGFKVAWVFPIYQAAPDDVYYY